MLRSDPSSLYGWSPRLYNDDRNSRISANQAKQKERREAMMPVGPLMIEHRLIEKLMPQIRKEVEGARLTGTIDPDFVEYALDFVRTYADRCHHGKEEDILFRELDRKPLPPGLRKTMDELVEEHKTGRRVVGELRLAKEAHKRGEEGALTAVIEKLEFLAEFYPAHIRKEDEGFFLPCMDYFSAEEQAALLKEEMEFDCEFVHKIYREKIAAWAEKIRI
jgi:hemerythrin-like domain-containing protein